MNLEEQFYQQFPRVGENYGTVSVIYAQKGGSESILPNNPVPIEKFST